MSTYKKCNKQNADIKAIVNFVWYCFSVNFFSCFSKCDVFSFKFVLREFNSIYCFAVGLMSASKCLYLCVSVFGHVSASSVSFEKCSVLKRVAVVSVARQNFTVQSTPFMCIIMNRTLNVHFKALKATTEKSKRKKWLAPTQ